MRVRAAAWLALAGCAGGGPATVPGPVSFAPTQVEEAVTAVLVAALDADRRAEPVDSLWDSGATVVADGALREEAPRFAGIDPGGEVAITSSRLEVRQSLVWVFLDYRWISLRDGVAREGRATVLLVPRGEAGGWKIIHSHSSTVRSEK